MLEQKSNVVDMLQRAAKIMGHGIGESLKLLVGRGKLCCAFFYSSFKIASCRFKGTIARLDLFKHFVEGLDEEREFVAGARDLRTYGVVAFARNDLRGIRQPCEGVGYQMPNSRRREKGDGKAYDQHPG